MTIISRTRGLAMNFWKMFFDSWNKSNIVSGLVALTLTGLIVYLAVSKIAIPESVSFSYGAITTYFFVDKQAKAVARREKETAERAASVYK